MTLSFCHSFFCICRNTSHFIKDDLVDLLTKKRLNGLKIMLSIHFTNSATLPQSLLNKWLESLFNKCYFLSWYTQPEKYKEIWITRTKWLRLNHNLNIILIVILSKIFLFHWSIFYLSFPKTQIPLCSSDDSSGPLDTCLLYDFHLKNIIFSQ